MPFLAPLIPVIGGALASAAPAIGAGASIAGSLLGSKGGTGTTTSSVQFDPLSQGIRQNLASLLQGKLKQPLSMDPNLLSLALGGLNRSFNSSLPGLQNIMSARGLGQSGLFGGNLQNLDLARIGGVSTLMNQLAGTATERQNTTINQLLSLASPTGQTTTNTGSTTGAIGAGLGDLGTTLGLLSILRGASPGVVSGTPNLSGMPTLLQMAPELLRAGG